VRRDGGAAFVGHVQGRARAAVAVARAEQLRGGRVHVDDIARGILGGDAVGHTLEDRAQLLLGSAHERVQVDVLERDDGLRGEVLEQLALGR
jgi:hypothetical protein